ncbi:MAG: DUF1634 domain-containing protein [Chloroflexi bacterium]|nr:DUF1634 domain-containing protein [Chloroflexota bacterium]
MAGQDAPGRRLELLIARLLNLGALASVTLLAIGVVLMALAGRSPLEPADQSLDLAMIPADILALRPEGFLWLGLIVVLATPASRVAASVIGFAAQRDRTMTLVSAGVLAVIAVGIALSVGQS